MRHTLLISLQNVLQQHICVRWSYVYLGLTPFSPGRVAKLLARSCLELALSCKSILWIYISCLLIWKWNMTKLNSTALFFIHIWLSLAQSISLFHYELVWLSLWHFSRSSSFWEYLQYLLTLFPRVRQIWHGRFILNYGNFTSPSWQHCAIFFYFNKILLAVWVAQY